MATIYADAVLGSDANPGTAALPVQHLPAAIALAQATNGGGMPVTIQLTNGQTFLPPNPGTPVIVTGIPMNVGSGSRYATGIVIMSPAGGASAVIDDDIPGNPASLVISGPGACLILENVKIQNTNPDNPGGSGLFVQAQAGCFISSAQSGRASDVRFGPCGGQHIHLEAAAYLEDTAGYFIDGGGAYHLAMSTGSTFVKDNYPTTITEPVTFSGAFLTMDSQSRARICAGASFPGGQNVTGTCVNLTGDSVLDFNDNIHNWLDFPGTAVGLIQNGSRLLPNVPPVVVNGAAMTVDPRSGTYSCALYPTATFSGVVEIKLQFPMDVCQVSATWNGASLSVGPLDATHRTWWVNGTFEATGSVYLSFSTMGD